MAEQSLRVPPHSVEAEQSVLGSVLIDAAAFEQAAQVLQASAFYRLEHRLIWQAMAALLQAGKVVDIITVHEALGADAQAVGGLRYLNDLARSVPTARNVLAYAHIVVQRARRRQLIALAMALMGDAWEHADDDARLDALVDRAIIDLMALQQGAGGTEPRVIGDLLPPWLDSLQERADGKTDAIPTGLNDVDRLLSGGVRRGELVVIGARPSMGKSALMLTIARNMARLGPVLACSMEDSDMMLVSRQVASAGRVNLADIRSPERAPSSMWDGVSEGVEALRDLPLYIDDRPALALADVRRKALQVRRRAGDLLLVVVDYLQLMDGEGETRANQLATIARGLKTMAKEFRVAVLLLSQVSRAAEELNGPPRLEHLKESGGIEEAADIIGLLWRAHRKKPTSENKHQAQVEFAKHKNGPTDTVHLHFDGATQRFMDTAWEVEHA